MGKMIVLRFNGDLTQSGFQVNCIIQEEIHQSDSYALNTIADISGFLSADSQLDQQVDQWQTKYRNLGDNFFRDIKPKKTSTQSNWLQRKKECEQSAQQLKERFNSWLDSSEFRQVDRKIREKISSSEEIRFLIRTDNEKLHKLPWQEWDLIKNYPNSEVTFGYKKLLQSSSSSQPILKSKIKILAILGNSEGINLEVDEHELKRLEQQGIAKVEILKETNRDEVNQKLWQGSWDIIFFAGHSITDQKRGRIYINSKGEYLELTDLWYSLRRAVEQGLKIAIFNSCDSWGLAQGLDDYHIPMMIVMRELLPDKVAHRFLINFLRAFQSGEPFHIAERQAREQLQGMEGDYPCVTWLPAIYQDIEIPSYQWVITPHHSFNCNIKTTILSALLSIFVVFFLKDFGLTSGLELNFYDQFMRMRPLETPDEKLVLIQINKQDREWIKNNFPQEHDQARTITDVPLRKLLKTVIQYNPRVIGLQIYHPDPAKDKELKGIFQNQEELITACHISDNEKDSPISYPPDILNDEVLNRESYKVLDQNTKALIQKRSGFDNVLIDDDTTVRLQLLTQSPGEKCLGISFSLALARRYFANKTPPIKLERISSNNELKLGSVVFNSLNYDKNGGYPVNQDYRGKQILLNYRSLRNIDDIASRTFTLREILENQNLESDWFRDKIILIGTADQQLRKSFITPYSKGMRDKTSALTIQAHQISQLINAVENNRVLLKVWSKWTEYLWVGGWSLIGALILFWRSSYRITLLREAIAIFLLSVSCYLLFLQGSWVPFIPAVIAIILAAGGTILLSLLFNTSKN